MYVYIGLKIDNLDREILYLQKIVATFDVEHTIRFMAPNYESDPKSVNIDKVSTVLRVYHLNFNAD